ncbi:peptidylprolyl isomerase, partial [Enterococcus gallinarum]
MALMQAGMTEEDLSKQMREQVKLKKLLGDKVKVTDDEVKEIFEQNKESFATPEQVRASHILVETKEEADKIYKELQEGADFAAIAKEKNQDATKDKGGDLDFFGRGEMDPAFEEAA